MILYLILCNLLRPTPMLSLVSYVPNPAKETDRLHWNVAEPVAVVGGTQVEMPVLWTEEGRYLADGEDMALLCCCRHEPRDSKLP
jgi:hypothetical protein